ncbi:hypothetical protein TorRG33x02_014510, partial [Trema orientale]
MAGLGSNSLWIPSVFFSLLRVFSPSYGFSCAAFFGVGCLPQSRFSRILAAVGALSQLKMARERDGGIWGTSSSLFVPACIPFWAASNDIFRIRIQDVVGFSFHLKFDDSALLQLLMNQMSHWVNLRNHGGGTVEVMMVHDIDDGDDVLVFSTV